VILVQLNPQQVAVVNHPYEQSLLVVAGAGSGKTTVLAHRTIAIANALPSHQSVQMLTFSNKAAKEMMLRIKRIGTTDLDRILCDTYHSWGIKQLKADPEGFGLSEGFTLLSDSDTKRSIRALAKSHGLPKEIPQEDRRRLNPKAWLSTWSLARQAGFDVNNLDNYQSLTDRLAKAHNLQGDEIELAWQTLRGYELEKQKANSVDFDDLIYLPLLRLAKDINFAPSINCSIGHVVIDEVQDTNRIQYEVVRRWVNGYCPVTAVGDDDQSIYGWRGAEISNLRRFKSHFSASELRLEQNYRSTQSIVNCATSLIRVNVDRLEKTPFSTADVGSDLTMRLFDTSRDMSEDLCDLIAKKIENGVPPKEISVLYRTNRMAMLIEQSLGRRGIPFHVVGGMSLFDRAEIVAITSAIRLSFNPRDVYALKNLTPYIDGIGPGSGYVVQEWLESDDSFSLSNLPDEIPGLSKARRDALDIFFNDLVMEVGTSSSAEQFIQWSIDGPMQLLVREKDDQMREKRAVFLSALAVDLTLESAERFASDGRSRWQDVLLDAALRDARQSESEGGQITLSTVHRAKGLEWDYVFIPGFSEGLMPLANRSELDDDEAGFSHTEEERRLAFVGVTRARLGLVAMHADEYFFPGSKDEQTFTPSRFAEELGLFLNDFRNKPSVDIDDINFEIDRGSFASELSRLITPRSM